MNKKQIILVFIIFTVTIFIAATTTYFIQAYRFQRFQEAEKNVYNSSLSNEVVDSSHDTTIEKEDNTETETIEKENPDNNSNDSDGEVIISSDEDEILDEAIMPEDRENEFVDRVRRQAEEFPDIFYLQGGFKPKVAISFDDGPNPHHTPDILEVLNHYNVPATFFVLGSQVQYHPEILRNIHHDGHEVANHSYTHTNFASITIEQATQEIERTNDIIERQIGYRPEIIRPPYGFITDSQLDYFNDKNYKFVNWSLDTMDWNEDVNDPEIMASRVKRLLHPGAIILLHDGGGDRTNTVKVLPDLIEYIEEFGYELVTVSELLQDD